MPCCAIITCKNKSQTSSIQQGGITFHRFPKQASIREQWMNVTGRKNWISTKTSTICSEHFKEGDFVVKKSGNRYLTPGAIPCIKIVHITDDTLPLENARLLTAPNSTPSTPRNSMKRRNIEQNLMSASNASTPRKRKLQNIINTKELIMRQKLQIKRIQAQNRRLKKKINKIEDILRNIQEKFCLKNEDIMNFSK